MKNLQATFMNSGGKIPGLNSLRNLRAVLASLVSFMLLSTAFVNCGGTANVEVTQLVATVERDENNQVITSIDDTVVTHDLFSLQPGQLAKLSSFGIADPVGTTLSADFDGDGLLNVSELSGNYWVADYPMVETELVPPVTMKIIVESTVGSTSTEIVSDISSSDMESRRNEGSEKFHQNELAAKTIKVGSTTNSRKSSSSVNVRSSVSGSAGFKIFGIGASVSASSKSTRNVSSSSDSSTTNDLYSTRPFVNNIDRGTKSMKSANAATQARQYRSDKKEKNVTDTKIGPNSGIVRASLYIKNLSVNMPVRLSNILCSLLFETAEGELIPIESFRLRNADYSLFSVEVYGKSEFGPYVIELSGLNTAEIEDALTKGYTPKIYIVNYDMTHVPDSNYRSTLSSSFTGDNLKIIEENAKGRTSLIKIIGPHMREMYRVAAFDINPAPTTLCDPNTVLSTANVTPGVSLKLALQRIGCSGMYIEYEHYVFDFSGTSLESEIQNYYIHGIKSINGYTNNFPCSDSIPGTDNQGNAVNACLVKVSNLTETEINEAAIWTIYANGRYFDHTVQAKDGVGDPITFDGVIPSMEGIESSVWAGDNYDITYLSFFTILNRKRDHGLNPLESGGVITLNTKWNKQDVSPNPYYPDTHSVYLGKAALGEKMEFTIQLDNTYYLDPSFGTPAVAGGKSTYSNFSYNLTQETIHRFYLEEAFDFEVNFSTGGNKSDWFNISRTVTDPFTNLPTRTDTNNNDASFLNCGQTMDFVTQTFTVCIQIPLTLPLAVPGGDVGVYIRPALNNAYRETTWPQHYSDVKQFDSNLIEGYDIGDSMIEVHNSNGSLNMGWLENNTPITIGIDIYRISQVIYHDRVYEIAIESPTVATPVFTEGDTIWVAGGLSFLSGSVKTTTVGGETVFKVIPNYATDTLSLGTVEAGSTISIAGNLYKVSSVSLFSKVYTIKLASPLLEAHLGNEQVYVDGDLTQQEISLVIDDSFVTDWNTEYVNSHNAGISPYDGRLLYTGDISSCDYGLDDFDYLAPGCQGYDPGFLISNWLGAGSFENDWSDASKPVEIGSPFIQTSLLSGMSYDHIENDIQISTANPVDRFYPVVAMSGDRAVVAWHSWDNVVDSDIHGSVIDMTTRTVISTDLLFSTTNANTQQVPQVAISGDRALAVWYHSDGVNRFVRGCRINVSDGTMMDGGDIPISTSNTLFPDQAQVAISGDRALVVWTYNESGGRIRGAIVDMTDGSILGNADFIISNTGASNSINPVQVAVYGSQALVVWTHLTDIKGRWISLTSGTSAGGDFVISSTNTNLQDRPQVSISKDHAIVVWRSMDNGTDLDIRGRLIKRFSNSMVGNSDFLISNSDANTQDLPQVTVSGDRAMVVWQSKDNLVDLDIRGRMVDMTNGNLIGNSDFLVSTTNANDQKLPQVSSSGDHALVVWQSVEAGWPIRARRVDMTNGVPLGSADLSLKNYANSHGSAPQVALWGEHAMAIWSASITSTPGNQVRGSYIFPQYNDNNFMAYPLIERNYSVTTRLLWN
ncbi:MAG: LIC12048 family lipoprotein [Leptospirales bacterium]